MRDVGYKLWQILSERLEEDVNKSNFRSTIERLHITSSKNICVVTHHNVNFYSPHKPEDTQLNQDSPVNHYSKKSYIDLALAPKLTHFQGRSK